MMYHVTRICKKCGEERDLSEFYTFRNGPKLGHRYICKSCVKRRVMGWRRNNKDRVAGYQRRYSYGIDSREFGAKHQAQKGLCAICHKSRKLCVDHDHGTGEFRGLLCHECNSAIGLLRDDPVLVERALVYLITPLENIA